jgi:hypothetical protein
MPEEAQTMRARLFVGLFGLLAGLGLVLAEPSQGQTPLVPIGRPFTIASGFSPGNIKNVPIDTRSSVIPVPGQTTGFFLPNFMRFMRFPNRNIIQGTSPLPAPSAFGGGTFSNALNPFAQPKSK